MRRELKGHAAFAHEEPERKKSGVARWLPPHSRRFSDPILLIKWHDTANWLKQVSGAVHGQVARCFLN
ncbi:MAG: hypothetical protein V3V05_00205 [Pontiella sp.]